MRALAIPVEIPRHDAGRWGMCLAVVMAAHVAAAVALLRHPVSEADFGVESPIVLIELPESLITAAVPPTELAPGPKEEEVEETPPPKEQAKPPEPEAEVAMPMPEPPKPAPPQEVKQATAPPAAAPSPASVHRWESELVAHIERFKRYPAVARSRGDQGLARIAFTIDRDGWVQGSRLVHSSGSTELDQEALAMLTRAQPMPRPPGRIQLSELSFVVPVRFNIR